MRYYSLYSVKIKHYNHILKETVSLYRKVTDFFLQVCLKEWDVLSTKTAHQKLLYIEQLCHQTKKNPNIAYKTFDQKFFINFLVTCVELRLPKQLVKYLPIKVIWETGLMKFQPFVEESLRYQKQGLFTHVYIERICINRQVSILQELRYMFAIHGIGSISSFVNQMWIISIVIAATENSALLRCRNMDINGF